MSITLILGLILVTTLVSADRTQQEVSSDVNRNPILCSSLSALSVDPNELIGDWIIKQSLLFDRGVIIPENALGEQSCFDICWKFSVKPQDNKLIVKRLTYVKSENVTTEKTIHVESKEKTGRFKVIVPSHKDLELVVISGNPACHLIVAKCTPVRVTPDKPPVQVLETLGLLSRSQGQRGQSVYKVQELQAQVEMLKLVGLSEVQWSVPYDTTC